MHVIRSMTDELRKLFQRLSVGKVKLKILNNQLYW